METSVSDVLAPGNVAVITGASSGIGHALACHCASLGMSVVLVDIEGLETACPAVQARVPEGSSAKIVGQVTDVSSRESVEAMRQAVCGAFDTVHFLVANAGIGNGAGALEAPEQWDKTIGVNMWGVINMCQAIAPVMAEKGQPGMVVCTGSKQGITAPPGNLAYNVSKAAVKTFTEGLAHDLRNRAGCRTSAHLLVPGWTNTSIVLKSMKRGNPAAFDLEKVPFHEAKPHAGAWTCEQVVEYLLEWLAKGKVSERGQGGEEEKEEKEEKEGNTRNGCSASIGPLAAWLSLSLYCTMFYSVTTRALLTLLISVPGTPRFI